MKRVSLTLPDKVLAALDARVQPYKRSQFVAYAVLAMQARLEKRLLDAVGYENAAKALVRE